MHTSPSGKSYIGQTSDFKKRCKEHRLGSKCTAFSNAVKRYGWDAFTHQVLADGLSLEEANQLEAALISQHNTIIPHGYNLRSGGDNGLHSEETKRKMSRVQKGKTISPEAREKMSKAKIGLQLTDDHRSKISESLKGRPVSEETRKKIALSLNGHSLSDATRAKISATKKAAAAARREKEKEAAQGGLSMLKQAT